jgi:serine-type D-Ala-D-Ala carboxypeptidase (penicillin-binding protein 5/6)
VRRRRLAPVAVLVALAAVAGPSPASAKVPVPPDVDARAWVLVEADDGDQLTAHDPSAQLPIASTTKLMTAYVSMRELPLSRRVSFPYYVPTGPESLLGLEQGERIRVRDLLYGLILASANDGAVALAQASSGSVEDFVREMNRTAGALGLADTSYANPIGLDAPENYSSAADLAALARRLLDSRMFREIADSESRVIHTDRRTKEIETRNELLNRVGWVNGVKTGFTLDAGYVLVGSGTRKGVTLVSVVLGAPTAAVRDADTLALLDWGFSLYHRERPVRRDRPLARPEVDSGGRIPLVPKRNFEVTLRDGEKVDTAIRAPEELDGPIRRGQRLGRVSVSVEGREAGVVPLVAAASAPAATLPEQLEQRLPVSLPVAIAVLVAVVILIAMLVILRVRRARP